MAKIDWFFAEKIPANEQRHSNDDALFSRLANGDFQALLFLFYRYGPILRSMLLAMLGKAQEADFLLQDTFLQLWQYPNSYQSRHGTLKAWLVLYARQLAMGYLNKMALEGHMTSSDEKLSQLDWRPARMRAPQACQHLSFWQQLTVTEQIILQVLFLGPMAHTRQTISSDLIQYHLENIQRRFIGRLHIPAEEANDA